MLPVSRVSSRDYLRSSSRRESPVYHRSDGVPTAAVEPRSISAHGSTERRSSHSRARTSSPFRIRVVEGQDRTFVRVTLSGDRVRGRSDSPARCRVCQGSTRPLATAYPPAAFTTPTNTEKNQATATSISTRAVQVQTDEDDGMKHEHADVAAMRDRCRLLERAVRETREMLRARDGEIERLKREMARLVEEHQREREEDRRALQQVNAASLKMQAEREQGTLRPKRSFHVAARNGREVATAVPRKAWSEAEARARQKSLEVFCTKTDEWSGADVCEAVRDLNSEVLQFAAGVSELCATTTTRGGARNSPAKPAVQAIQDTAARLGPGFVRVLASRDHGRDPILVQFALQSLLSACVARFFASFCPGLASKYDMLLCQIYEHMRATRAQATSARWRALTHHHIRALYRTVEEHALNELAATMLRWTADLLAAAGCREAQAAFAAPVALKTRFGPQLRRIVLAVGKLAQVTREEILSTNFEVGTVPQGTAYDATEMCDAAEDGEAAAAQAAAAGRAKVLCCTELGLRCTTRKEDAGEEEDEEGTMDETLLLKPKVVLESIVAALDR